MGKTDIRGSQQIGGGNWSPTADSRLMAALATVMMVMVGFFTLGNLIGRSVELPESAEPPPAAVPDGSNPGEWDDAAQAAADGEAAADGPAAADAEPSAGERAADEPAAAGQAATDAERAGGAGPAPRAGLGESVIARPPLPPDLMGPYGSWRTINAGFVALTFDDGPDPRWTPQVLQLLRDHDAKATFCVVGHLAATYPALVREIAADGHTLCNHSWDHDFGLGSRPRAQISEDLERTNAAIRAAVPGAPISYYRQPGGEWTERVVAVAAELGMSSLHWQVDPQDWRQPAPDVIADLVADSETGAIVLLHDGGGERGATVQALRQVLPVLARRSALDSLPPAARPPVRADRQFVLE